jgi:hypothetical protein
MSNRFGGYFFYRLRFLLSRTAISTVVHAAKVVLLLGVFPRSEFLVIVIIQGSVALAGDFWWGALEQMRAEIRTLQRRQARHVIPREIGRWLTVSTRIASAVGVVALLYGVARALDGSLAAVDALVVALLIGAALDLVARTYHSGAYAMRRVYRPLPSLLALDFVSVGLLLGLWPFIGIWAFPVAELVSVLVVVSISLAYTTRTYRTLAIPTLVPLLRMRMPAPRSRALRASIGPGISYALVGLEALIVVAGIATATTATGTTLVILLAALAPVSRASFEWARLLYFDLKRMDVPLLANLRRRFDAAILRLAVLIGVGTGLISAVVAVFLVDAFTPLLIVALVALFTVRSVLAAAQMQAFTRTAYTRLTVAGVGGVIAVIACLYLPAAADARLLGVAGALAISLLLLLSLPSGGRTDEGVIDLADWLVRLRAAPTSVTVMKLTFDDRLSKRGTTAEARRSEAWRRRNVAHRLGAGLLRRRGAATWVTPTVLWTFEPVRLPPTAAQETGPQNQAEQIVRMSAGLIEAAPDVREWAAGTLAAPELAEDAVAVQGLVAARTLPLISDLLADFTRRFPHGLVYDTARSAPAAIAAMPSRARAEIYRAALQFARGQHRGRGPQTWDVTALVSNGSLRAIFCIDRKEEAAARRAWRDEVRAWTVRAAAGLAQGASVTGAVATPGHKAPAADTDPAAQEGAML